MQNLRYNVMLSAFWGKALDCDPEAVKLVLAILTRIDLINGTIPDKPLINMTSLEVNQNPNWIPIGELARMASKYGEDTSVESFDEQNN